MREKKKTIQKSVRMTPEVFNYVCRMGNAGFNANFEKMVLFCMKREKILYDQVQVLERRKRELEKEIEDYESCLITMKEFEQHVEKIISTRKR